MESVVDAQQIYDDAMAQLANLDRALSGEPEIESPGFIEDLFKAVGDSDKSRGVL